jgi:hypothetical protein
MTLPALWCRVVGHRWGRWRKVKPPTGSPGEFIEVDKYRQPITEKRRCKRCGQTEART